MKPLHEKSTLEEIRTRFDGDVERFSNIETGQSTTIDAALAMELITHAAMHATLSIENVLDIGCGAGNNTLKLLDAHGDFNATLLDISEPMLERAEERVRAATSGNVRVIHQDLRQAELADESFDVILAAAVLHHLREDDDWQAAFEKIYRILKPGGSVWITDLVSHETAAVQAMMWARYGDYLIDMKDEAYRDHVFAYVDKEDSPRPVTYQLDLLRSVGFRNVEILHKNSCFAAFGAIK